MTLTLADIEIWDDAAVDQVFAAATARAEGAQSAGEAVGDLLSFIPWHGRVAAAAQSSADLIKISLRDHEDQCRRVAAAVSKAAADIADLKYRLSRIRADAREAFISIDNLTGALTTKPAALTVRQSEHQRIVLQQLPTRINRLLDDADSTDRVLATAIETADGTTDSSVLTAKPPAESSSPADRKKWWDNLTPPQQLDCLAQDPVTLDRDGIPVKIRDAANRMRLGRELAAAKGALAQATRDEAAYWQHVNTHHGEPPPGIAADPVTALGNAQVRYDDLLAIQRALGPKAVGTERRSLIMLDTRSDPNRVLGVIGVGDVDHAAHVGVTTGGVSTDATSLPQMVDEATNLQHTTSQILERAGDLDPDSVATVAWVGYLPPASMVDVDVAGDGVARAAAPRLNSFLNGLAATSANPHQEITAFGHSYGSLVTSLALQQGGPGHGPVHNVVFYGSPGLELRHLSDLHLTPGGHAYYEQAAADPIAWVQRGPKILDAFPVLGRRLNLLFGSGDHHQRFGDTPNEVSGIGQLSTSAGPDGMNVHRAGATGHSQYTRDDGTSEHALRMSGYNLAAVLSGVATAVKPGR